MKKLSLISAAVLMALSLSANADPAKYQLTDLNPHLDSATLHGVTGMDTKNGDDWFQNNTIQGSIGEIVIDNQDESHSSYIKVTKGTLTVNGDINFLEKDYVNLATIEFDSNASEGIDIRGTVNLANNSLLRIQEYKNAEPDNTKAHFNEINMSGTSALALGVSLFGNKSANDITIDTINVMDGTEDSMTGIAVGKAFEGLGKDANAEIKVGTINIDNNKFSLALTKEDIPQDFKDELSAVALKNTTLRSQQEGETVNINMSGANSQLILGNVGEVIDGKSDTNLNITFIDEEAFNSEESSISFGEGAVIVEGTNLDLTAVNAAKGTTAENVAVLQTLADKVTTLEGQQFASTEVKATSDVFDAVSASLNEKGEVDQSTIASVENAEVMGFAQLHSVGVMQWREEMNHMQLRLGEIRDAAGYDNGAWARVYNGKDKYGSQNVENKFYGVQVGYDHRLEGTNWIVGGAFSYARGDSDFNAGEGDNHSFTFTGYGTWLAENGLFVDVTGKVGRLSNDVTMDKYQYTSSYDTNAVSVTAEAGWRFAFNDMFYVEPQAEMMYGHIMGADFETPSYKAKTESVDMWVGRLGFQTGLTCPANKGGVYFRASVLHDFDGDTETTFTGMETGGVRTVLEELGDTWYELGVGANYNITDNAYVYADFQYADGGEIETPWRWNLGVRVNF